MYFQDWSNDKALEERNNTINTPCSLGFQVGGLRAEGGRDLLNVHKQRVTKPLLELGS